MYLLRNWKIQLCGFCPVFCFRSSLRMIRSKPSQALRSLSDSHFVPLAEVIDLQNIQIAWTLKNSGIFSQKWTISPKKSLPGSLEFIFLARHRGRLKGIYSWKLLDLNRWWSATTMMFVDRKRSYHISKSLGCFFAIQFLFCFRYIYVSST